MGNQIARAQKVNSPVIEINYRHGVSDCRSGECLYMLSNRHSSGCAQPASAAAYPTFGMKESRKTQPSHVFNVYIFPHFDLYTFCMRLSCMCVCTPLSPCAIPSAPIVLGLPFAGCQSGNCCTSLLCTSLLYVLIRYVFISPRLLFQM